MNFSPRPCFKDLSNFDVIESNTLAAPCCLFNAFLMIPAKVCTLGVGLTGNWSGPSNPLIMNSVYANRQNSWSADTNQCLSTLDSSFYFLEVCAGLKPNITAQVQTSGAFPTPIGFDWLSTSQTGVDTGCRGGVVIMTNGVTIKLVQLGGGVYSATRQTGWSLFSITNSMGNASGLFSAYGATPYTGYE